jgi:hypothetical protein
LPQGELYEVIRCLEDHLLAPASMAPHNVRYINESEFLGLIHNELSMNSEMGIPLSKIDKYYTTNGLMSTNIPNDELALPNGAIYEQRKNFQESSRPKI